MQLKKQKRHNRKVNRNKYNLLREEAAKTDVMNEVRRKLGKQIQNLNNKIKEKTSNIEDLECESEYWQEEHKYTYQKYIASLTVALSSIIGWYITIYDTGNCRCE